MAKYYSFEKGKYGGATGTIFPFVRTLSGKDPSGSDWQSYVPAGYLRCDGSILRADKFRRLSEIIGIGDDCIYKKDNITLQNADSNGVGGEIQLPDLGSKYMTAFSSNTGLILDATAQSPTDPTRTTEKVGVGVELTLNQGSTITVQYTGNLIFPQTNIPVSGNYALSMSSLSATGTYTAEQILAHGHYANASRLKREEPTIDNAAIDTPNDIDPPVAAYDIIEYESQGVPSYGSTESTQHFHSITRSSVTKNVSVVANQVNDVSGEGIITTVNLASSNTTAFNDINPAFILVEYLIKY